MPVTFPLFPASRALQRLVLGLPLAALITAALVMLMQGLIAQEAPPAPSRAPVPVIEIVSTMEDTAPIGRVRPVPTQEIERPDPIVERVVPEPGGAPGPVGRLPDPAPPGVTPTEPTGGFAQASLPPRLIFAPRLEYPQRMYPREGSCTVGFDVGPAGKTSNVAIVSCTDRGFANAAIRAAEAFQYQPAQNAQGPVTARGLRVALEFRIDE